MLLKNAEFLLKELRRSLKIYLKEAKIAPIDSKEKWLMQKRGVFVTLSTYPAHELRGCIGYIEPVYSLGKIALQAAISAALDDPRFSPVSLDELDKLVLELSVLNEPRRIEAKTPHALCKKINIGKDGLIVRQGEKSGLLLPQVATEHKLSKEEFLAHCCMKAALPPSAWTDQKIEVLKFQAEVFSETSPEGRVIKKQ